VLSVVFEDFFLTSSVSKVAQTKCIRPPCIEDGLEVDEYWFSVEFEDVDDFKSFTGLLMNQFSQLAQAIYENFAEYMVRYLIQEISSFSHYGAKSKEEQYNMIKSAQVLNLIVFPALQLICKDLPGNNPSLLELTNISEALAVWNPSQPELAVLRFKFLANLQPLFMNNPNHLPNVLACLFDYITASSAMDSVPTSPFDKFKTTLDEAIDSLSSLIQRLSKYLVVSEMLLPVITEVSLVVSHYWCCS
jgi:hypothetical protein